MTAYQGESGLIAISTSILLIASIALVYHRLPTTTSTQLRRSQPWINHLLLLGLALGVIFLVPTNIAKYVFTDLAVTAVGTVFPIYESIRAICTPEEEDDKVWLQYWLVGGILFLCTGWVDNVMEDFNVIIRWYECACFFFLWLYLPPTNGATLIYHHWTGPILTPLARPLATKMSYWIIYVYQTLVNGVHLWLLWIIFVFLPVPGLKRIIAIAIGTVYPWLASTVAAATDDVDDDTTWLTYWSCYGILFLIMDVVEVWLYWVPGFYSLIIFVTVYLMLPMFQGADKVFRHILVPLAGLQELLLLKDAMHVKKTMLKTLRPERAALVRRAIAKIL
jgi:TB2/DP1, HVA22 family